MLYSNHQLWKEVANMKYVEQLTDDDLKKIFESGQGNTFF